MTAIASWVNKEMSKRNYPWSIWTIGDSKVIDLSTQTNLSLESSKVFELEVVCYDNSTLPPRLNPYYKHTIGYAYAGSSLVGLNCFATLHTILRHLGGSPCDIPDLFSIAEKVAKVVDYYVKSICYGNNRFEAIIYGYCHVKCKLERYQIRSMGSTYNSNFINNDDLFLLGDMKKEIEQQILLEMENIEDKDSIAFWRTPLRVLSSITISNKYDTIGGGTQLNIANEWGCEAYYASGEKASSSGRFRNIDIYEDIGKTIGPCLISIYGMYYHAK